MSNIYNNLVSVTNHPKLKTDNSTQCIFDIQCPNFFPVFEFRGETGDGESFWEIWTECDPCKRVGHVAELRVPKNKNSVLFICDECKKPTMRVSGIVKRDFEMWVRKDYV